MLQGEHSAIFLTCNKRYLVLTTNFWTFWEWLFYTGFTVHQIVVGDILKEKEINRFFLMKIKFGIFMIISSYSRELTGLFFQDRINDAFTAIMIDALKQTKNKINTIRTNYLITNQTLMRDILAQFQIRQKTKDICRRWKATFNLLRTNKHFVK